MAPFSFLRINFIKLFDIENSLQYNGRNIKN